MRIREARLSDAEALATIYNHYIEHSVATFQEVPLSDSEMSRRLSSLGSEWPWLVCEHRAEIVGYAYATPWKERSAYRFSVEVAVYTAPGRGGEGIGSRLYGDLLPKLRQLGAHGILAGIALPNDASVALHEKMGFIKVAHLREVGWKKNRWIDVGYWQLVFGQEDPVDIKAKAGEIPRPS